MSDIKRNYKDSLFKIVFGEHKDNALALYNAINGTDYTDTDELMVVTLKDAVYIGIKNDTAFIIENVLNLYEHQSSYNPNMPLRGMDYFADMYKQYVTGLPGGETRLYGVRLINIPTPRYYVFYNGTSIQPESVDLKLSDAYEGKGDVEVIAHMININKGQNQSLMDRCKPLADYSEFVSRVRSNMVAGMSKEDAVEGAIDSCIADGVMVEILRKERVKVARSLYTGITEEEMEWVRNFEREEMLKEEHAKGIDEFAELAKYLISENRMDDLKKAIEDREFRNQLLADMKSWSD